MAEAQGDLGSQCIQLCLDGVAAAPLSGGAAWSPLARQRLGQLALGRRQLGLQLCQLAQDGVEVDVLVCKDRKR